MSGILTLCYTMDPELVPCPMIARVEVSYYYYYYYGCLQLSELYDYEHDGKSLWEKRYAAAADYYPVTVTVGTRHVALLFSLHWASEGARKGPPKLNVPYIHVYLGHFFHRLFMLTNILYGIPDVYSMR